MQRKKQVSSYIMFKNLLFSIWKCQFLTYICQSQTNDSLYIVMFLLLMNGWPISVPKANFNNYTGVLKITLRVCAHTLWNQYLILFLCVKIPCNTHKPILKEIPVTVVSGVNIFSWLATFVWIMATTGLYLMQDVWSHCKMTMHIIRI